LFSASASFRWCKRVFFFVVCPQWARSWESSFHPAARQTHA
jgi:hypothetical protein